MIVDTSAVVSLVLRETDYVTFREKLVVERECRMGAPSWLEAVMVITSRGGAAARQDLDDLRQTGLLEIVDFTSRHAEAASEAWFRYGKGRNPASLNFGDCMAYAVAKVAGEPLLYKGNDFAQTDIVSALA